jgi:hypothetical protein
VIVDWGAQRRLQEAEQPNDEDGRCGLRSVLSLYRRYLDAAQAARSVGREIAGWIKQQGVLPHRTVISGHSLGGQIAAFASNECARPEVWGQPVHTIIAADPAGPFFEACSPEQRLDSTDAKHVIVVHTTEVFGDENPIGTWDIYPFWPESEHPCPIRRHSRARHLVTASFASRRPAARSAIDLAALQHDESHIWRLEADAAIALLSRSSFRQ